MGKSNLEKRVGVLGTMVAVLLAAVVVLCVLILVGQEADEKREARLVELVEASDKVLIRDGTNYGLEVRGTSGNKVWLAPTPEPVVSDALAVATVNDYAKLEATRIAKMASITMDMGGEYAASCKVKYNSVTDKVEAEYSIRWYRRGDVMDVITTERKKQRVGREGISQIWTGASWGECIAKMTAWKGGE